MSHRNVFVLVISPKQIKIRPYFYKQIEETLTYSNHFEVEIPFAGTEVKWDIFLNENDYEFAPDFDFKSETFLNDPDLDIIIEHIPSLTEWNIKNPKSFSNVIGEFLDLYKKTQVSIAYTLLEI